MIRKLKNVLFINTFKNSEWIEIFHDPYMQQIGYRKINGDDPATLAFVDVCKIVCWEEVPIRHVIIDSKTKLGRLKPILLPANYHPYESFIQGPDTVIESYEYEWSRWKMEKAEKSGHQSWLFSWFG